MEFVKYNSYKEGKVYSTQIATAVSSLGTSNDIPSRSDGSSDRTLWGNNDTGNDLNNSMKVEGNIYLKSFYYDESDDDNDSKDKGDTDDSWIDDDTEENGSLYADGLIKSSSMEAKEIYATEHLCVPNPETGVKTDILKLMVDYSDRITANRKLILDNQSNIQTNTDNITTINGTLASLQTQIARNKLDIATNKTNIANLTTSLDNLIIKVDSIKSCTCSGSGNSGSNSSVPYITTINDKVIWAGKAVNDNMFSGIVMKDDDNDSIVDFSPTQLPDFYDFTLDGTIQPTLTYSQVVTQYYRDIVETDEDGTGIYYASNFVDLGYCNTGDIIRIDTINCLLENNVLKFSNTHCGYSIYRKNGNRYEAVRGGDGTAVYYSVTNAGEYAFTISFSGTLTSNNLISKDYQVTFNFSCHYTAHTNSTIGQIAPNGIAWQYSDDKVIISETGAYFKYGEYYLSITAEGIKVGKDGTERDLI